VSEHTNHEELQIFLNSCPDDLVEVPSNAEETPTEERE